MLQESQEFQEVIPFTEPPINSGRVWDLFGIAASTLCILDCVALPIVSSVLILTDWLPLGEIHLWLYPTILLTAFIAFYRSYRKEKNNLMLAFAAVGCTALLMSLFLTHAHSFVGGVFSLVGGFALVSAHGINLWHFKKHPQCYHH